MKYPKLIILYGRFQNETNHKQQMMIDGKCTCGYREYAKKFGEIIYLAPQETREYNYTSITEHKKCDRIYDSSIINYRYGKEGLIAYLNSYMNKDAIIWSVKHCPEKDEMLKQIDNKKVYYSCCSNNMYNPYCDISLVDLPERVKHNGHLWVKGKNPGYWLPGKIKVIDFLIMGRRGDKNELFFLDKMRHSKEEYTIQWIGGKAFKDRVNTKHNVLYTPFLGMDDVKELIPCSKVGVILSEHPAEGFPQTFLEFTMCGLPTIYLYKGKPNWSYMHNAVGIVDKNNVVEVAEKVLNEWTIEQSHKVRQFAIDNYSLEKSYESILRGLF